MGKQPETNLVARMRKAMEAEGAETIKHHGGPFSRTGDPDIFCCYPDPEYHGLGVFVVVEAKVPGEEPERIQVYMMERWRRKGARVGWAETVEQALAIMRGEYPGAPERPEDRQGPIVRRRGGGLMPAS